MLRFDRRDFIIAAPCALVGCGAAAPDQARAVARARPDLYQCEGCEGSLERNPSQLANYERIGPGLDDGEALRLQGIVYRPDGQTPASDVVLYAYHTNAAGMYANGSPETEASRRHGRLRGWVRTGSDGRYSFDTIKPAPYPNDTMPAHIHFTVLERGRQPYWIDDIVFANEFGVTSAYRSSMTNKGGNGIVNLARTSDGKLVARRDIILELHPY